MKIIGHRGAAGLAPENTIASIKKALEAKVDMVEVDVRVNPANQAVLSHEEEIPKAAPKLSQAIKTVDRRCPIILEIKPGEPVTPIVDVVDGYLAKSWRREDFMVASFDPDVLLQIRKVLPDVELIILEKWSGVRARVRADRVGTKRIAMNQRWLWTGFIRAMEREGYKLSAYTLDDPVKAKKWQQNGLDGIITDYPDRFKGYN